jgi:hypothetical protein
LWLDAEDVHPADGPQMVKHRLLGAGRVTGLDAREDRTVSIQ